MLVQGKPNFPMDGKISDKTNLKKKCKTIVKFEFALVLEKINKY